MNQYRMRAPQLTQYQHHNHHTSSHHQHKSRSYFNNQFNPNFQQFNPFNNLNPSTGVEFGKSDDLTAAQQLIEFSNNPNLNGSSLLNTQTDDSMYDSSGSDDDEETDNENVYADEEGYSKSDQAEWVSLNEAKFKLIKSDASMFEFIFSKNILEEADFKAQIKKMFGINQLDPMQPKENYLQLIRADFEQFLAENNESFETNNLVLANCLLNKTFSKVKLNRLFEFLNGSDLGDNYLSSIPIKSRLTYLSNDLTRRQKLIDFGGEENFFKSFSNGSKVVEPLQDNLKQCLSLLTKENLLCCD